MLNVLHYGRETGGHDRIPDRAIGPTDDLLYEAEGEDNGRDLAGRLRPSLRELDGRATAQKRELRIELRREQLERLIDVSYQERGCNGAGIPLPQTLMDLGLGGFLADEARAIISRLTA